MYRFFYLNYNKIIIKKYVILKTININNNFKFLNEKVENILNKFPTIRTFFRKIQY